MASTGEEFGLFWNSVSGDRTYDSDSFSNWLKKFFTTGVFNGDFQVVANSGMQVKVKGGYANIAGKVYFMDNDKTLTLAVANSTYPRIDTIVITCDYINRRIFVENITGQLSGNSPVATAPVRNTEKYQIVLAQIRVNAGVTSITQAQITDTRTNNNLCGYIAGTVTQMNFAQFTAQFESYFTQFKNNNLESFNTWFNGIKEQLTDDVAGNLQSQIDATNSDLTSKYNELKNASNINYSNTSSKLTATKVQGAIDEVVNKVNTANNNINTANSNISGLTTRVGTLENGLSTANSNISSANTNINALKTRATNLETRASSLETKATNLENELTANNKRIYMDYHDGKYGINTNANRGADTFIPFKGYEYLGTVGSYDLSNRADYKKLTNANFTVVITGISESVFSENWSADDVRGGFSGSVPIPQPSYNASTGALTITNIGVRGVTGGNVTSNGISYAIEVYLFY